MTLRARLALALAVLAALSVVVVSWLGYVATVHRLNAETDAGLVSYAQRLADPDGRLAAILCGRVTGFDDVDDGGVLPDLPGASVQCQPSPTGTTGSGSTDRVVTTAVKLRTETREGTRYRVLTVPLADGRVIRIARSQAGTDRVLASLLRRSMGIGLVTIVLAALAGWLIVRRSTRPILRLTGAAEAIAATGRLDIPVPGGGRDETGRLSAAFASMLAALKSSKEQQHSLVQDAGHELRTPLTSLTANVETLLRHPNLNDGMRDRILADLDSELRELASLVDELVALATDRHDSEAVRPVSVLEVAERACGRTRRRTGREISVDAEPWTALVAPDRLLRAVGNLLDNAAKFSPGGTPIEVVIRPGRIEVRDHGPGIAPEDLPHVFDRFYRSLAARSLPGSGLGLAIVRDVAESAGGSAMAANHPDGGAVLSITLPVSPASAEPLEPPSAEFLTDI